MSNRILQMLRFIVQWTFNVFPNWIDRPLLSYHFRWALHFPFRWIECLVLFLHEIRLLQHPLTLISMLKHTQSNSWTSTDSILIVTHCGHPSDQIVTFVKDTLYINSKQTSHRNSCLVLSCDMTWTIQKTYSHLGPLSSRDYLPHWVKHAHIHREI